MEFLMLMIRRSHILLLDVKHQALRFILIDSVEFHSVDQRRNPRRADHDIHIIGVDSLAVLFVALRTYRLMGEFSHMSLQHFSSDLHLYKDNEKSRHECVANLEHIEVKKRIEHICKIAVTLQLCKDLKCANLKKLVDIAEESLEIVIEVLARVHEHGVEDESIEEDEHLQEDGHDEREGEAKVFVEVVHLVVFLPLWELEDGQDLKESANRCILGAEENDDAH